MMYWIKTCGSPPLRIPGSRPMESSSATALGPCPIDLRSQPFDVDSRDQDLDVTSRTQYQVASAKIAFAGAGRQWQFQSSMCSDNAINRAGQHNVRVQQFTLKLTTKVSHSSGLGSFDMHGFER
jgi:hypothetical protein